MHPDRTLRNTKNTQLNAQCRDCKRRHQQRGFQGGARLEVRHKQQQSEACCPDMPEMGSSRGSSRFGLHSLLQGIMGQKSQNVPM